MARLSKLLVAIDGSGPANAATALALDLAAESRAEIVFCFVVAGDPPERARSAGQTVLDVARTQADMADIEARCELLEGDPVKTILERSVALGSSAIVIGTHGRGGVAKLFLGSTAEGVLRASDVPVIVVRMATTY